MKNEDEPKDKRLKPGYAQKLTMAEVAKYVGVSAMTVSR
ncbi:LacI family transcriptional regulator, partial [Rhizobium ruizarguesonis]